MASRRRYKTLSPAGGRTRNGSARSIEHSPGAHGVVGQKRHIAWAAAGWLAMAYMSLQMMTLLVSATQIRALGVLDSIVAILAFVVGLVLVFEWLLGHVQFSVFQWNSLALLIASALGEFLLTIWIRFVINRRTIAIDTASTRLSIGSANVGAPW